MLQIIDDINIFPGSLFIDTKVKEREPENEVERVVTNLQEPCVPVTTHCPSSHHYVTERPQECLDQA